MAIDRIGTSANAQILLTKLRNAENALDQSNQQVVSGKVATNYAGYGDKTAALEAARSAAAKADANAATAQQAANRLDLQDTQLTQLSDLAGKVRQAITDAIANNDGSQLMTQLQGYFQQATQILNSKDGSGYIFGGDKNTTPPVTASSLSDLAALPDVASAFANGTQKTMLRVDTNQTVQIGMLASDLGSQLFAVFRDVAQFDQGANGPLGSNPSPAQQDFLQAELQNSTAAAGDVNSQAAANGITYRAVQDVSQRLQAQSTVYKSFVSDIEDVDMGAAVSRLNENQVALQAALQMTARLNNLSLLNYMTTATG